MDRFNDMDIFDALEERIDDLLVRMKTLEDENKELRAELLRERNGKDAVTSRIDGLLKKIQEEIT